MQLLHGAQRIPQVALKWAQCLRDAPGQTEDAPFHGLHGPITGFWLLPGAAVSGASWLLLAVGHSRRACPGLGVVLRGQPGSAASTHSVGIGLVC